MVTMKQFLFGLGLMLCLAACGKNTEPTPKTAEQAKSEREASAAKARESAVFGDQLKAMDKAKDTADAASKAAEERVKQINDAK
jgi:hypothetical protein